MESEPKWPAAFGYEGVTDLSKRERFAFNQGWNRCREVSIAAFNEWRKEQEKEGKT